MIKNKKIFLLATMASLACSTLLVEAQTNSPYSRYGFGRLRDQASGPSKAMGGVGYALHTQQSANPMNPASYAQVDSLTFIFDIGVNFNNTTLKEGGVSKSKSNGGLDYITMLLPLSKQLGLSFGILPFSSTGYKYASVADAETGEGKYTKLFSGSGGLSQVYLGLGYKLPIKGLSIGANASYLFGTIDHHRSIPLTSIGGANTSSEASSLNITAAKVDIGLQYQLKLRGNSSLTLGAVYTPQMNSKGNLKRYRQLIESGSNVISTDTIVSKNIAAGTPHSFGLGAAYIHQEKLLVSADITFQHWKKVKFSHLLGDGLNESDRFNNRWKFAVGAEYRIAPYSKNFIKKVKFRGGFNYSNSYVNVNTANGTPKGFNEYGASLGFGIPITDREDIGARTSYININFEYKTLKPEVSSMVKENYFGVALNMNINELWFWQRKIR